MNGDEAMRALHLALTFLLAAFSAGALAQNDAAPGAPAAASSAVSAASSANAANFAPNDPPGEWRSQARDYANTRYSPLDQITAANVARLRVAWTLLRRHAERPRGGAARRRRHDVHRHAVSQPRLRARPDQGRRADQVVVRPEARRRWRSARPAATRSTAAAPTPTAS